MTVMPHPKMPVETIVSAVDSFIARTSELTTKAWKDLALPVSSTTVTKYLGGGTFSLGICEYASKHAPDAKMYVWPICPRGKRHETNDYFMGTPVDWKDGQCAVCTTKEDRYQGWLDEQPTFASKHPHLVPYLFHPEDAQSRGHVQFRCSECQQHAGAWSPDFGPVPVCSVCRACGDAQPGDLVARGGGGSRVKLEEELTKALCELGLEADNTVGIVTKRGSYCVPVVKPDVVLPALRIAVELDNSPTSGYSLNRHDTASGIADDQLRDQVLADVGWRTLRIRRPDQAVENDWPWRVETTSQSARKLAALVGAACELAGEPEVATP